MPFPHNTLSVTVILQLSEVTEKENPGISYYKTHAFSVMPGSPVLSGEMGTLLRIGSAHGTMLIGFICNLSQSDVIRETA